MNYFQKLFLSKEVKIILSDLKLLGQEFLKESDNINDLGCGVAWNQVEKDIEQFILKTSKKATDAMKQKKLTTKPFLLNLINKYSLDYVTSGNHHIYRGHLSMTGEGYFKLYKYSLIQSEKLNMITKEDIKEILFDVNNSIKSVG